MRLPPPFFMEDEMGFQHIQIKGVHDPLKETKLVFPQYGGGSGESDEYGNPAKGLMGVMTGPNGGGTGPSGKTMPLAVTHSFADISKGPNGGGGVAQTPMVAVGQRR